MSLIHHINILPLLLIVTMKNTNKNQSVQSDVSDGAKVSETHKAIEACQNDMKQIIHDLQSTMQREIHYSEQSMDRTIKHLESVLKIWNEDLK